MSELRTDRHLTHASTCSAPSAATVVSRTYGRSGPSDGSARSDSGTGLASCTASPRDGRDARHEHSFG
jgi:hypothetical protein